MRGFLMVMTRSQAAVVNNVLASALLISIQPHPLPLSLSPPAGKPGGKSGSGVAKPENLCSVEGAEYSECGGACPPTCLDPYILCLIQGCFPGCACPDGQLMDTVNNRCVPLEACPPPGM